MTALRVFSRLVSVSLALAGCGGDVAETDCSSRSAADCLAEEGQCAFVRLPEDDAEACRLLCSAADACSAGSCQKVQTTSTTNVGTDDGPYYADVCLSAED